MNGALEAGSETAAAILVVTLRTRAQITRELAYRLYTILERKKCPAVAHSYNKGLVQSWPEMKQVARESSTATSEQEECFKC